MILWQCLSDMGLYSHSFPAVSICSALARRAGRAKLTGILFPEMHQEVDAWKCLFCSTEKDHVCFWRTGFSVYICLLLCFGYWRWNRVYQTFRSLLGVQSASLHLKKWTFIQQTLVQELKMTVGPFLLSCWYAMQYSHVAKQEKD